MPIQEKFNRFTTVSPVLVNYSFQETLTNTGFINYFAFVSKDVEVLSYHLTTQTPRSEEIETRVTTPSTLRNFDSSPFEISQTARGDALITGTYHYQETIAGQETKLTIEIIRLRGITETILGSAETQTFTATEQKNFTMSMTLTEQEFIIGDILRIKLTPTVVAGDDNAYFSMGTDPANRDGGTILPSSEDATTQLKLAMPFALRI